MMGQVSVGVGGAAGAPAGSFDVSARTAAASSSFALSAAPNTPGPGWPVAESAAPTGVKEAVSEAVSGTLAVARTPGAAGEEVIREGPVATESLVTAEEAGTAPP